MFLEQTLFPSTNHIGVGERVRPERAWATKCDHFDLKVTQAKRLT